MLDVKKLHFSQAFASVHEACLETISAGKARGVNLTPFFFTHLSFTRHPFTTLWRKEEPAAEYMTRLGRAAGGKIRRDSIGNVCIDFPGRGRGVDAKPIILQGHLDMYCQGADGKEHDFKANPMRLVALRNHTVKGEKPGEEKVLPIAIKAVGTNCGHDGRAAASLSMCAVMDPEIADCPPLRVISTVGEEEDFRGAINIDRTFLEGAQCLISLDASAPAQVRIACGGLRTYRADVNVLRAELLPGHISFKIEVSKLTDMHASLYPKGRAQATALLNHLVKELLEIPEVALTEYRSGKEDQFFAIQTAGHIVVAAPESRAGEIQSLVEKFPQWEQARWRADPNIEHKITQVENLPTYIVNAKEIFERLCDVQTGVVAWEGEAEASDPLELKYFGSINSLDDCIRVQGGFRAYDNSRLDPAIEDIRTRIGDPSRFEIRDRDSAYSTPRDSSFVLAVIDGVKKASGAADVVRYLSGLELSVFQILQPELPIVAMGPGIYGQHGAEEALDLTTVAPCALALKEIFLTLCTNKVSTKS